jgi:hypothetical protein
LGLVADGGIDSYDEYRTITISAEGKTALTMPIRSLSRYRRTDAHRSAAYTASKRIQWALGTGFADSINEITEVETLGDLQRVVVRGVMEGLPECEWELVVDPGADYLVRASTFRLKSGGVPLMRSESFGSRQVGRLTLAERGFVRLRINELESIEEAVTLIEFLPDCNDELFHVARVELEKALKGQVDTFDFREDVNRPRIHRSESTFRHPNGGLQPP